MSRSQTHVTIETASEALAGVVRASLAIGLDPRERVVVAYHRDCPLLPASHRPNLGPERPWAWGDGTVEEVVAILGEERRPALERTIAARADDQIVLVIAKADGLVDFGRAPFPDLATA